MAPFSETARRFRFFIEFSEKMYQTARRFRKRRKLKKRRPKPLVTGGRLHFASNRALWVQMTFLIANSRSQYQKLGGVMEKHKGTPEVRGVSRHHPSHFSMLRLAQPSGSLRSETTPKPHPNLSQTMPNGGKKHKQKRGPTRWVGLWL